MLALPRRLKKPRLTRMALPASTRGRLRSRLAKLLLRIRRAHLSWLRKWRPGWVRLRWYNKFSFDDGSTVSNFKRLRITAGKPVMSWIVLFVSALARPATSWSVSWIAFFKKVERCDPWYVNSRISIQVRLPRHRILTESLDFIKYNSPQFYILLFLL